MKKWISFDFDTEQTNEGQENKSINIKEINNTSNPSKLHERKSSIFNFHKKIAPKSISDLAINKKKIEQVQNWLIDFVIENTMKAPPLLVLTGPTGCGKTACVSVLCKLMNIDILEWINPIGSDYNYENGPGQSTKFLEFISESKYPSLVTFNNKKIVLVEDFPNNFIRNNVEFHDVLDQIAQSVKIPVVFICTESNDKKTNLHQILFPENVTIKHDIQTISFNAVSVTLLKNALKRTEKILEENKDLFKAPPGDVLEAIANSSMGDIRCAVNNYHLASISGCNVLKINHTKSKKRKLNGSKATTVTTKTILRDESLGLFHLLGRILNPKRKDYNNSWRLDCNLNDIVDEFSNYPYNGISFIHHNYLKYFGDFTDACKASSVLSQTEIFTRKSFEIPELYTLGLWYCTLGFMIYNEHKTSKWNQINAPKKPEKIEELQDFDHTDGCYYDIIKKTNKFHKFTN